MQPRAGPAPRQAVVACHASASGGDQRSNTRTAAETNCLRVKML